MSHPLEGVNRKLARAYKHLDELGDEIDLFLHPPDSEEPYDSVAEQENESGKRRLRAVVRDDPPWHWGVVIGDVLHNLRSSLDHLAWKLGGDPPPNPASSEFPIFKDRGFFRGTALGAGRSGYEKTMGIEDRAQAIIEDVQPFNRRDDPELEPLWLLHELSREDKHRLLILTGFIFEGSVQGEIRPGEPDQLGLYLTDLGGTLRTGPFKNGDILAEWSPGDLTPEPKSHDDLDALFGIAFAPEGPGRGLPVLDTLHAARRDIEDEIAGRLAPFF